MSISTYEDLNTQGYKIVVLPVRIKRGTVGSAEIVSVKVRNFSEEETLTQDYQLSFKLKAEYLNPGNFNVAENSLSIWGAFLQSNPAPGHIHYINYDSSIGFTPSVEDYNLGVSATLDTQEHYFDFFVSFEPINDFGVNLGESNAEVIVDYLDTNHIAKSIRFSVKGTASIPVGVSNVDGIELELVSTLYTFDINSIKIN